MQAAPAKYVYSFSDYEQDVKIFADMINQEKRFTHIIAPYRGGLPLGVALSNKTESPLSIIKYQRYDGVPHGIYDGVSMMHNAGITSNELIVLVDDLVDEGITMIKCVEYLRTMFPMNPIKVYTLFGRKSIDIDAEATYLREHPGRWIHFEPWE